MALDTGTSFTSSFNFASSSAGSGPFTGTVDTTTRVGDGWTSIYQPIANTDSGGAFFEDGTLKFWGIAGTVMTPFYEVYSSVAIRTAKGGVVILQTDGTFTYTPPAGAAVIDDTFEYYQVNTDLSVSMPLVAHLQFAEPEAPPSLIAPPDQTLVPPQPDEDNSAGTTNSATAPANNSVDSVLVTESSSTNIVAPEQQAPAPAQVVETTATATESSSGLVADTGTPAVALVVAGTDQPVASLPQTSPPLPVQEPASVTTAPTAPPSSVAAAPVGGAIAVTPDANKTAFNGNLSDVDGQAAGWVSYDAISSGFALSIAPSEAGAMEYLRIGGTVMTPFPEVFSAVAIRTAKGGIVILNTDGSFGYTAPAGFVGVDSFQYALVDQQGKILPGIGTATIAVEPVALAQIDPIPVADLVVADVTPPEMASASPETNATVEPEVAPPVVMNTAPIAQNDMFVASHSRNLLGNVMSDNGSGTDADADRDALTVESYTAAANGVVSIDAAGSFTYAAKPGFLGIDSFDYTVRDNNGNTDTATVTIKVTNAGPTAVDEDQIVSYGTSANGNVLDNDSDADGDAISVVPMAMRVTPNGGFFTIKSDGTYKYTPKPGFVGIDAITYEIKDSFGAVGKATLTIETVALANSSFGTSGDDAMSGTAGADNLFGGDGRDSVRGGTGNDILAGQEGADTLYGDGGSDTLAGGTGIDKLYGGSGADKFVVGSKKAGDVDRIMDFSSGDRILVEATELGVDTASGALPDSSYFARAGAAPAGHWRLVYNSGNKGLYFDADGSSATADVLIASFASKVSLSSTDFEIV
jgi:Ca2+-binding RTX toxin-like protein